MGQCVGELVAEVDGFTGGLEKSYTWDPTKQGGVGGLLSVSTYAWSSYGYSYWTGTYLPVANSHGDIVSLIDQGTGAVVETYTYSAYGVRTAGNPEMDVCPFAFDGYYTDKEVLHLSFAINGHVLNADLCSWMQKDLVGEDIDPNVYRFCHGDSINEADPTGLAGVGHHLVPQSLFRRASRVVRDFFDSAQARVTGAEWNHGGGSVELQDAAGKVIKEVDFLDYNELVAAESKRLFGKAVNKLSLEEAKVFLQHIKSLPKTNPISLYNMGMRKAAAFVGRTPKVVLTAEELASGAFRKSLGGLTEEAVGTLATEAVEQGAERAIEGAVVRKGGASTLAAAAPGVDVILTIMMMEGTADGAEIHSPPISETTQYPVAPPGWMDEKVPVVTEMLEETEYFNGFGNPSGGSTEIGYIDHLIRWVPRRQVYTTYGAGEVVVSRTLFGVETHTQERHFIPAAGYGYELGWESMSEHDRAAAWEAYRNGRTSVREAPGPFSGRVFTDPH